MDIKFVWSIDGQGLYLHRVLRLLCRVENVNEVVLSYVPTLKYGSLWIQGPDRLHAGDAKHPPGGRRTSRDSQGYGVAWLQATRYRGIVRWSFREAENSEVG